MRFYNIKNINLFNFIWDDEPQKIQYPSNFVHCYGRWWNTDRIMTIEVKRVESSLKWEDRPEEIISTWDNVVTFVDGTKESIVVAVAEETAQRQHKEVIKTLFRIEEDEC